MWMPACSGMLDAGALNSHMGGKVELKADLKLCESLAFGQQPSQLADWWSVAPRDFILDFRCCYQDAALSRPSARSS
jgi:hypothetical protein